MTEYYLMLSHHLTLQCPIFLPHPQPVTLPVFPFIFVGTVSSTRSETSDILEFSPSHTVSHEVLSALRNLFEMELLLQPSAASQLLPVLVLQIPTGLSPTIVFLPSSAVSL